MAAMQDFAAVNRYKKPEVGQLSGLNPVQIYCLCHVTKA